VSFINFYICKFMFLKTVGEGPLNLLQATL
jgi:hypothetical protein